MKHLILTIFAAVLVAFHAFAATEVVDGITWTYEVQDGMVYLGSFSFSTRAIPTSTTGAMTIPSTLGGYPVTSIGNYAFYGCSGLTSVTIPDSVTSIGDYAFDDCSGLTSVTIPSSVTSIGSQAFCGCSGLADANGFIVVKGTLYDYCGNDVSIVIPDSVTDIGNAAFRDCSGLASVTIPDSVKTIGEQAFRDCCSLMTVTIPNSVTSVGSGAFFGCKAIKDVVVPGWKCEIDFSSVTNLVIAEGTTNINNYAFYYSCGSLTSVTIPNSVTGIGEWAFSGCSGLASVTIPEGVTRIGNYAFSGCSGLKSVAIPDSVTSIGWDAFDGTPFYNNLPDGLVILGRVVYAMKGSYPVIIKIPDGVAGIAPYAFNDSHGGCIGCYSYSDPQSVSVTIPNSVENIGTGAFDSGLKSVYVDMGDADRIKELFLRAGRNVDGIHFVEIGEPLGYDANSGIADGDMVPFASAAVVYDGCIYNDDMLAGIIQVKIAKGKVDKNGKLAAKMTATVKMTDGTKKVYKNGHVDATGKVLPYSDVWNLELQVGIYGLLGELSAPVPQPPDVLCWGERIDYRIDGARNVFAAKDDAAKGRANAAMSAYQGVYNMIWDGGQLSISVAAKGRVKVSGMIGETKISGVSSQLLVGEECACIPVVITKKANLAFNLWIEGGMVEVGNVGDAAGVRALLWEHLSIG